MKKTIVVLSVMSLLVVSSIAIAATQPDCPEGQTYVGGYVEETVCQDVCDWYFWGWCMHWSQNCETTGEWVGYCVDNEVEEPEEPSEPLNGAGGGSMPIHILQQRVSNFTYYDGKIQFLGGYMGQAGLLVFDLNGNLVDKYVDEGNYTFHVFDINLEAGDYFIIPYQNQGNQIFKWQGKEFTIN